MNKTQVSYDETIEKTSIVGSFHEVSSEHEVLFKKSPGEENFVKKIKLTLLPFVGSIFFIQFVDKATLSTSAMMGIIQDTKLTHSQFSWLGSIFYLSFILFQIPNNFPLQKFLISKYLGTLVFLWGIVMCFTTLCTNLTQLAACSVLLGLFEAGTYPSLLIIINSVYRRSERSAAYGFLWLSNSFGTMVGSLCSYGTPTSFMFRLNEEEKEIVKEGVKDNAVVLVYEIKKHHIFEALKEPRLWLICFSTLCNNLHTDGLVVFSTILVQAFGFAPEHSLLLQIPNGFVTVLFSILAVVVARKSGQLYLGVAISTTISLISYFIGCSSSSNIAVMLLAITGANVTGYTKKIFYNGMNMIFFNPGNFIGPLVMLGKEAHVYTGMIIYCIANGTILVLLFVNRQIMARQNQTQ